MDVTSVRLSTLFLLAVVLQVVCNQQNADNAHPAPPCVFEPDWRPTHLHESTVEISKVTLDRVIVAVDSSQYALSEAKCNSGACKSWKPKEGGYYPATIVDKPAYVPTCLKVGTQWEENRMHAALTASRALCVGFGKMTVENLRFGATRTSEFESCYAVSALASKVDRQGKSAPRSGFSISNGVAYCEYWRLNRDGEWQSKVQRCSE
jgi:hypothetical protein